MTTAREPRELRVQRCLMKDSARRIEEGFRALHDEPAEIQVRVENWLKPEAPAPRWDNYKHRAKWVDLVGINEDSKLVLCECKWGGGEGDDAPQQLRDYYLMLKTDTRAKDELKRLARERCGIENIDFERDVLLYIIVAGHVSQLLFERIQLMGPEYSHLFRVFQALPIDDDPRSEEWACRRVP